MQGTETSNLNENMTLVTDIWYLIIKHTVIFWRFADRASQYIYLSN